MGVVDVNDTPKNSILEDVKTLLGAEAAEEQIEVSISLATSSVLNRMNRYGSDKTEVPEDLNFIVIELAVARYNRIGSEGMSSESIEGLSTSYISNLLDQYDSDIRAAVSEDFKRPKKGRVKFI